MQHPFLFNAFKKYIIFSHSNLQSWESYTDSLSVEEDMQYMPTISLYDNAMYVLQNEGKRR